MSAVGLMMIVAGLTGSPLWIAIAIGGAVAMAFAVLVYSYVVWRGEQRRADCGRRHLVTVGVRLQSRVGARP
jgi:hypothetical protein